MQLQLSPTLEDYRIAKLSALAIGIHVLESVLPSPIPGLKPGMANIVTLLVFLLYGLNAVVWVSMLRVIVGSLVIGSFLSPTFVLSLSGAVASIFILFLLSNLKQLEISAVGIAVLMAMAHMTSQFVVVYVLFIPHHALFDILPVMMTAALVFGIFNGILAKKIFQKLNSVNG